MAVLILAHDTDSAVIAIAQAIRLSGVGDQ
jgi:hypothetical protein